MILPVPFVPVRTSLVTPGLASTPHIPFGGAIHQTTPLPVPQTQRTALLPQHVLFAQRHTSYAFTRNPLPPSATENHASQHTTTAYSGPSKAWAAIQSAPASVSSSTWPPAASVSMKTGVSTSAASVDESIQPSLATPPVFVLPKAPSELDPITPPSFSPNFLQYTDFSATILHRSPLPNTTASDSEIYNRIITPYDPQAFNKLLSEYDLSDKYPFLVNNLTYGFPMGDMPHLTESIIIPNHPSITEHLKAVYEYINTELDAQRMSGPFSQTETEHILRGPFYCSPFVVVSQDQGPNLPPKIRICRHLSKDAASMASVNSFIDKEDFPTRFDMPPKVAEAVSPSLFPITYHPIPNTHPTIIHHTSIITYHLRIKSLCADHIPTSRLPRPHQAPKHVHSTSKHSIAHVPSSQPTNPT